MTQTINKKAKICGPILAEFDLIAPNDYEHDKFIDQYRRSIIDSDKVVYWHEGLTSENFKNATNKLEPGKKYVGKIRQFLIERGSIKDCMDFLESENAILFGTHGLLLAHSLHKDQFPEKGKYVISFDKEEALWRVGNDARVAGIRRFSLNRWAFDTGLFHFMGSNPDYVLYFQGK